MSRDKRGEKELLNLALFLSEHVSECITVGLTSSAGMENDLVSV